MRLDPSDWGGHRANLLRYVGRQVDEVAMREDIVQEALLRFLSFEAKPDNAVGNVPALLRRISLNLIRDHFRRAKRMPLGELSEEIACPLPMADQQIERRQLIALVAEALKAMPKLRREVFMRRRILGQSAGDVAEALGLSASAVSNHVARALFDLDSAIEKIEKRGNPDRF